MTAAAELKRQELCHKLASISREFDHWKSESQKGRALRKHNSQIAAVTSELEPLASRVSAKLSSLGDEKLMSEWQFVEALILGIHRVWEFYRSKLALRYVEWFSRLLSLADEFAWRCYKPAQDHFSGKVANGRTVKEPPLVFFNGGASPFASSRGMSYQVEQVPGEPLPGDALTELLKGLPIPIIGIPWHMIAHLPDAVVIGHEVGHNVEDDFGLTDTIHTLVKNAVIGSNSDCWDRWTGEVFADVYGALATGPAFVGGLMDFLVTDSQNMAKELAAYETLADYPPVVIRAAIGLATLRSSKLTKEAVALEETWDKWFVLSEAGTLADEAGRVVDALIKGPYPQFGVKGLQRLMSFGKSDQAESEKVADQILRRESPGSQSVRHLVAGARLAFSLSPEKYQATGADGLTAQDRIVDKVVRSMTDEVRSSDRRQADRPKSGEGMALLDLIERAEGRKL